MFVPWSLWITTSVLHDEGTVTASRSFVAITASLQCSAEDRILLNSIMNMYIY